MRSHVCAEVGADNARRLGVMLGANRLEDVLARLINTAAVIDRVLAALVDHSRLAVGMFVEIERANLHVLVEEGTRSHTLHFTHICTIVSSFGGIL